MSQLRMFKKILILCLLGIAAVGKGEKTEFNHMPKNIIVLLADVLTADGNISEERGLDSNGSISNDLSSPPIVFLKEKMPIRGVIMSEEQRHNASGGDWGILNIIFNGLDAEDNGNDSTSRYQTNLMHIAQKAGKLTGLISTVDITSEIPTAIYGSHLESRNSNCSNSDQLQSMNIVLGQVPVHVTKNTNIRKCLSNHTHANSNLLLQKLGEESKENKSYVLGLLPHIGRQDLKIITPAAFQFLRKSENGFFLVVSIAGKGPVTNMKMATLFLEKLLPSDLLNETLVVAVLVENTNSWNISDINEGYGYNPPVATSKQNNSKTARKKIPLKETEKDMVSGTGEDTSKKTNQKTGEDNLKNTKQEINAKEEDKVKDNQSISGTGEHTSQKTNQKTGEDNLKNTIQEIDAKEEEKVKDNQSSSGTGEHTSQKTNQKTGEDNLKNTIQEINAKEEDKVKDNQTLLITETISSGSEPVSTVSAEKYENYSSGISIHFSVNVDTISYSPMGPTLATEFEMNSDVQAPSSPSAATEVSTSLSLETTVIISEKNTYSSNFPAADMLSTTETIFVEENKVLQNDTDYSSITSRKKREAELKKLEGITFYASGPGSRSFNRTLWPHDMRRLLEIYISSSCETTHFAELTEFSIANCSEKAKLPGISALSSSAMAWNEKNFICLGIAVTYAIVITN